MMQLGLGTFCVHVCFRGAGLRGVPEQSGEGFVPEGGEGVRRDRHGLLRLLLLLRPRRRHRRHR